MSPADITLFLLPVGACLAATLLLVRLPGPGTRTRARQLMREAENSVTLLFEGDTLVDATPAARGMLKRGGDHASDRDTLVALLSHAFPDLGDRLADAEAGGTFHLRTETGPEWIEAEYWDGLVRITIHGSDDPAGGPPALAIAAMEEELDLLRSLGEDSPQLIWRQDADGTITWANSAYLAVEGRIAQRPPDAVPTWPPERIFGPITLPETLDAPDRRRLSIPDPEAGGESWFDVTSCRRGTHTVHFAVDANVAVRAEAAQRDFIQTLSRTFADLATGLVIFDSTRRLVMFNPALMELTGLPVDFLATRPLIHSFLDRLREQRMLPEPRNYRNWREEIAALEAEAADGSYCEAWALPGGQTYRVTGRPHPDGALAFLFEDITAEMSLTRRFRSQIDTAHAVLDSLTEGIAVFSGGGTLIMSNRTYDRMWSRTADTDETTGDMPLREERLRDEIERWKSRFVPTDLWSDIRTMVATNEGRRSWTRRVRRSDGRVTHVRVIPLVGGATMVGFAAEDQETELQALLPAPQAGSGAG